jgi:hypothetical protein
MNIDKRAKLWINNNWVYFKLNFGTHTNIITFLDNNNISFIKDYPIDFSKIPTIIHGYGNSKNLLEYLSNNINNEEIIISFLTYFINSLNFRYINNERIKINIITGNDWKSSNIIVINTNLLYFTVDTTHITSDNYVITVDRTIII